jgi:hypothetical protein
MIVNQMIVNVVLEAFVKVALEALVTKFLKDEEKKFKFCLQLKLNIRQVVEAEASILIQNG